MFYVYVLKSKKDGKLYIGFTEDLKKRFKEHNQGLVESTKPRRPLNLIFYEVFESKQDAVYREKFLKTGWGRIHLRKALKFTFKRK